MLYQDVALVVKPGVRMVRNLTHSCAMLFSGISRLLLFNLLFRS